VLKNYKKLKVWQKAYQQCVKIYKVTKKFSKNEGFGLISQMRRAALSIPGNIAKGYGRKTTPEYLRSLHSLWLDG
jgi:four helix bundle protein